MVEHPHGSVESVRVIVFLNVIELFGEIGEECFGLMDFGEEFVVFLRRGFIGVFLAKFDMISDNKEKANEKSDDKHPEYSDQKLGIKAAVFYVGPAVRYDNKGEKSVIHTELIPS
jgi:hypothetical protein